MIVKAVENFYDVAENLKLRTAGEEFEVDRKRFDHLYLHGLVKPVKPKKPDDTKKEQK